jgi:hypothetical protein
VAALGVPARQPAEARPADAAVLRPGVVRQVASAEPEAGVAVLPDARPAAVPSALPSEAASVFRQGLILAGPVP